MMDMIDIMLMVGGSILGGTITGIITVATLKTDVKWIIVLQEKHEKRISNLERMK